MRFVRIASLTCLLLAMTSAAYAAPITFDFSGVVTEIVDTQGVVDGLGVDLGSSFTGHFTYFGLDPDMVDFNTPTSQWVIASYDFSIGPLIGGVIYAHPRVDVQSDGSVAFFGYTTTYFPPIPQVNGITPYIDESGLALFSTPNAFGQLPFGLNPDSLLSGETFIGGNYFRTGGPESRSGSNALWTVRGAVTEAHQVPEPATLALVGLGAVVGGLRRFGRKSKQRTAAA